MGCMAGHMVTGAGCQAENGFVVAQRIGVHIHHLHTGERPVKAAHLFFTPAVLP